MILGACSLCGGTVEIPDTWMGIDPPRPRCRRCHATKKMKVIEMDEPCKPSRDFRIEETTPTEEQIEQHLKLIQAMRQKEMDEPRNRYGGATEADKAEAQAIRCMQDWEQSKSRTS